MRGQDSVEITAPHFVADGMHSGIVLGTKPVTAERARRIAE
jgi:hypothetical protein